MNAKSPQSPGPFAIGGAIELRRIMADDLDQISRFPFTVSILQPLADLPRLVRSFEESGFWNEEAGAAAIIERETGRLLGTSQFYRSAPCIHGLELGYIVHDPADRGRGAASEAVKLFSDYLFAISSTFYRQQLVIETWSVASWKLAERCAFVREGLLRSAGFGASDPADCFLYARTRKDWHEASHSPISLGGLHPAT